LVVNKVSIFRLVNFFGAVDVQFHQFFDASRYVSKRKTYGVFLFQPEELGGSNEKTGVF